MKISRKIKIGLAFVLVSFTVLFAFANIGVKAAAGDGVVTYHYSVYKQDTWDKYMAAQNNENFIVFDGLKVSEAMTADDVLPCLEDYVNSGESLLDAIGGEFYTNEDLQMNGGDYATSGTGRNQKYVLKSGAQLRTFNTDAEVYGVLSELFPWKDIGKYPTITQAVPGDQIFIAVTSEYTGGSSPNLISNVVLLDIAKYAQGGKYTKQAFLPDNWAPSNLTVSGIGEDLGGARTSSSGPVMPSPHLLGGIGFTISTGLSGSMKIEFLKTGVNAGHTQFTNGVTGSTSLKYSEANKAHFAEDDCVIQVAGLSDNVDLTDITVEGESCISKNTSVTIGGNSTLQYSGKESNDGTANVTVTVKDSGKLVAGSVKYGKTLANQSNTAQVSGDSFSVPLNGLNPGESYIATFQVISSSGNVTKTYAVELPKAKDTNCDLDGLDASGRTAGGQNAELKLDPVFSSSTTSYTLYVLKGTNSLKLTPTVSSSSKTIKVAYPANTTAQSINSGTAYTIPDDWTNNSQVKFTVTAQSGATKDYTVTLREVNLKPTSVNVTSGSIFNTSDTDSDNNDEFTITNMPYSCKTYNLAASWTNRTDIQSVNVYQNNIKSTGNLLTGAVTFMMSDNGSASTDEIRIEVISKYGIKQEFVVKVNRLAPNSDNALGTVQIVANNGSDTTICNTFSGNNLIVNYPGGASELPLSYKNFKVTATASNQYATVEIRINNNVQSSFTFSNGEAQSIPVQIKVTAEDGSSQTYTCTIKRAGADDDHDFHFENLEYTYLDGGGSTQTGTYQLVQGTSQANWSNTDTLLKFSTTKARFKIVPNSSTTKVYIGGVDYTNKVYECNITNTAAIHKVRIQALVKTEKDEIDRPGATVGGMTVNIDIESEAPDNTMQLTDVNLLHSSSGVTISDSTNTSINGNTYAYVLKESVVGPSYKLDLSWLSTTTKAYVSKTNSASQAIPQNEYNPNSIWSIGEKIYVILVAQSGNSLIYTIDPKFADERSTENGIQNVVLNDGTNDLNFTFNENQTTYPASGTFKVPFSVTSLNYDITVKHALETLAAGVNFLSGGIDANLHAKGNIQLKVGTNEFKVKGRAQNETYGQTYTFVVEREAGGTQKEIEGLVINGVDCTDTNYLGQNFDYVFKSSDRNFSFYLPRGTSYLDLQLGVSKNASYTITTDRGNPITNGPLYCTVSDGEVVSITINVKSETETVLGSGSGNTYNIKVYIADRDNKLDNLNIFKSESEQIDVEDVNGNFFQFDANTANLGTFTVPFKTSGVFLLPTKYGFNGSVTIENSTLTDLADGYTKSLPSATTYTVRIKVSSELANLAKADSKVNKAEQEFTYTLTIVRNKGSNNAFLQSLEIYVDGALQTFTMAFDKTKPGPYAVEYVQSTSSSIAQIEAIPEDSRATVTGAGIQNLILGNDTISQVFTIDVTAEDGVTKKQYRIQLWTTKANPDTDKTLTRIIANTDKNGTINKLTPTFSQATHQYNVKLSSLEEEAILRFTKQSGNSTLHIDDGNNLETTLDQSYDYHVPVAPEATVVVKVWLSAQDGTSTENDGYYEVIISRDPADTDATLKDFKVNGKPVTGFKAGDQGGSYKHFIGDAEEVWFEGTPSKTTTTITQNDAPTDNRQPLYVGDNQFVVTTTAQDGITQCQYIVNVVKDAPKTLDNLEVLVDGTNMLNPTFSSNILKGYTVNLTFDQDTAYVAYYSTYVDDGYNTVVVLDRNNKEYISGTHEIEIPNIPVGTSTYRVRVKTQSGATADYEVTFTRDAGSDDNTIIRYEYLKESTDSVLTELTLTPGGISYSYAVGRDIQTFDPTITCSDPNATIEWPQDMSLTPGQANKKQVTIVSQTGKRKVYTFTVYPCDTNFSIDDINALDQENGSDIFDIDGSSFIDYENKHLSITVPNSISQTYLEVVTGGYNSVTYVNGSRYDNKIVSLKEGTNNFVIYVVSEYGEASKDSSAKSEQVTVSIIRQAKSTDSSLKYLAVTYIDDSGNPQVFVHDALPGNSLLSVPYIGDNVTVVNIEAVPNDPTSKILGDGQRDLNDVEQAVFNFTVKCTAEDGSYTDYPIKISRGPIDPNKDNSLTYIEVSDGDGTLHLGQHNFKLEVDKYGVYHIPATAQNYTITVVKPGYAQSSVLIDGVAVLSSTKTTVILDSDRGKAKSVIVQVVAQDGTPGTAYTIDLEFDAPSDIASLDDLTADGVTVPGFSPEDQGGTYTLAPRPYETKSIEIGYKASDPTATITGDLGTQELKEGLNTFVVVVTSQAGTSYTYRIQVQRDYAAPYLTDLGAVGEKLLDTSYKSTTFDKEVYEYTMIVTYMTLHATIFASIDNESYTVSCSNSTAIITTGLTRTFNVDLVEGLNRFTITVTSVEGKTTEYVLTIKRRGEDSTNTDVASIEIKQIEVFKTDYTNDLREYAYQVPNGIHDLDFIVHPEKLADSNGDGATYKIINDKDLRVGHNTVVVLIIAEDMISTRAILIDVERLPMNFTVDEEAYDKFTCTSTDQKNVYEIDLGDKRASAIEDYTKYIQFSEEDYDSSNQFVKEPIVTVISDVSDENCREVVVSVFDGSEEQFVTFKLKSTALTTGYSIPEILKQIMPWILLAIAIIFLIIILICVNRDKYGAINKRRKKDDEAQQKKSRKKSEK